MALQQFCNSNQMLHWSSFPKQVSVSISHDNSKHCFCTHEFLSNIMFCTHSLRCHLVLMWSTQTHLNTEAPAHRPETGNAKHATREHQAHLLDPCPTSYRFPTGLWFLLHALDKAWNTSFPQKQVRTTFQTRRIHVGRVRVCSGSLVFVSCCLKSVKET